MAKAKKEVLGMEELNYGPYPTKEERLEDLAAKAIASLQAALAAEQERVREMEEAEREARICLALNHGHKGIYLDDGEIQCSSCKPNWNYKTASLLTVAKVAMGVLLTDNAALRERLRVVEERQK